MVDSHCHLADEAFANDVGDVIHRAQSAGLTNALCILAADQPVEARRGEELTRLWPSIRFAIGVHPHQAGHFEGRESEVTALVDLAIAAQSRARAIGEIGLDYHYDFAPKAIQQDVFRRQLHLARQRDLPIVIHTREADADTLALLREDRHTAVRGVLHCFTGTPALAEAGLELGLHISFAGIVTFPKATALRDVARLVPDDRLLCETDAPYLAPTPYRGKRNEPAWVVRVAEELAMLRQVPLERVRTQIAANFAALFRP